MKECSKINFPLRISLYSVRYSERTAVEMVVGEAEYRRLNVVVLVE